MPIKNEELQNKPWMKSGKVLPEVIEDIQQEEMKSFRVAEGQEQIKKQVHQNNMN